MSGRCSPSSVTSDPSPERVGGRGSRARSGRMLRRLVQLVEVLVAGQEAIHFGQSQFQVSLTSPNGLVATKVGYFSPTRSRQPVI